MAEVCEHVFRELVLQTMDAAIDEDCWPRLLQSLATACGGIGSIVAGCSFAQPNKGFMINGGLDPDIEQLFVQRYQGNLWAQAVLALRPDDAAIDIRSRVDHGRVAAAEFHADVLRPQRIRTMTPLGLPPGSGFDTGGLSIAFDGHDDDAPRAAVALLDLMAPYLRRAIQANLKLQAADGRGRGLVAALHGMPNAVLLLTQCMRIVFANGHAEELLAGDGLRVSNGELAAFSAEDTRALRRLVADAGCAAQGRSPQRPDAVAVARRSGKPPLSVLVVPVGDLHTRFELPHKPVALLIVSDPQQGLDISARAVDRLGLLFGLTPTEARVAVRVALGMSGPQAAADMGIGAGTVHAHLKSVFAKTGVHRQAGLTRLLTRSGVLDLA